MFSVYKAEHIANKNIQEKGKVRPAAYGVALYEQRRERQIEKRTREFFGVELKTNKTDETKFSNLDFVFFISYRYELPSRKNRPVCCRTLAART